MSGPLFPRFTQSALFAAFLETVTIEWSESSESLMLVCDGCSEALCEVEHDDTLAVLVRTALAHDVECPIRVAEQEREDQP